MNMLYFAPLVITFIIVAGFTINRLNSPVPVYGSALKGRARGIAYAGIFLTAAYFFILPPVYYSVDEFMPITNGTDLLAKYLVLTAVAFLGGHMSRAYQSDFARRWTVGRQGIIVFVVAALGILTTLLISQTPESSPQLLLYSDQASVKIHTWFVIAYNAYIVAPIVGPAIRDAKINPLRAARIASGLIAFGFALSILRFFTYALEFTSQGDIAYAFDLLSQGSAILVVVGLALFAYGRKQALADTSTPKSPLSLS